MHVCKSISAMLCVSAGVAFASAPALAASKGVVGFFGGTGTAGGLFDTPGGVAVNNTSGNVYVVDSGNNRVQEFSSGGAFIRAWGAGVASATAGGMSAPQGIAVEQVTGDVYVTDQGNRRVDEFTEAGGFVRAFGWGVATGASEPQVCTTTCEAGLSGAGAGEFGANIGYPAVDPTTGDVYVADPANRRVDVFAGDGVFVHAFGWGVANGTGEFQICTSTCQAGVASSNEIDLGRFAGGSPTRVALDASGNIYVVDGGAPDYRVQKFASVSKENAPLAEFFATAQLTGSSSATAPSDVAVEPTLGSVLAAREPSSPAEHLVYELGSGGALLRTYAEGAALPAPQGLAVGSSGASAYFSSASNNRVFVLGTTVAPSVTVEAVTGPTASEATLHGTVDPNETPPNGLETTWQFEYSTNQVEWIPLAGGKLAASTSPVAVTQTITGLEGSTVYYVRLHASKEFAAGNTTSTTVQFTTGAAAPTVSGEAVTKVSATSAVFSAQINPQHLDTTYHFEYDTTPYTTSATHGTSLPVPDADIGEGVSNATVSQEPQSLRPDTTYYYRVVATNSTGATDGPEHTFMTQTQGEELALLDGRAWEMVSPPNKNGAAIPAFSEEGSLTQAAAGGGAFAWDASAPIGTEVAGNRSPEFSQVLSTRGTGSWSSRDIAAPHEEVTGLSVGTRNEYTFFSPDLSLALFMPKGGDQTPLSPEATEPTIYLRENSSNSYVPLVTAANVPAGAKFGDTLNLEGASPDLSHVAFGTFVALTSNAPVISRKLPEERSYESLYEWAGGRLQLVSVLPESEGGMPVFGMPLLGNGRYYVRHAISNDGSRVVWSSSSRLYMRDMAKGETIRLDAAQGAPEPASAGAGFQIASADGRRVFFTDSEKLTAASMGSGLYMFETTNGEDEPLKGELTDLTVDPGESVGVQGVLPGASEDGSYIYLVATGVLSKAENTEHEKAAPGADNLYVLHDTGTDWTTTFIARLSSGDQDDWASGFQKSEFTDLTSRVSPDGHYLAFMSDRELTGYDNHDANSGEADEEVFLYDAGTERLVCASCDPTGARPVGILDEQDEHGEGAGDGYLGRRLIDEGRAWGGRWLAANVPGWTPVGGEFGTAYYQSRYLSDSGRLFFNSSDALVPQDTDGTEDVYEYEPVGIGSAEGGCVASSPTFNEASGGCVDLISSGQSAKESVFLDADESGGEVFFSTAARLLPQQDYDKSYDVYDAHECTTQSPCTSAPVSSPECSTADACRAPSPLQPSSFGAPPSATFSGAGNPVPATTVSRKPTVKPLTRAQKLAKALKACKQKPKRKRPACERQARKQYGAPKAKKMSKADR